MDTGTGFREYDISSLDNFKDLGVDIREKQNTLAESLASSHLMYEDALSKAHDFFSGNYDAFLNSFCCAKLQSIEVDKITRKYQQD